MNKIINIFKYLIGWPLSVISLYFVFTLIISNTKSLNNLQNVNFIYLFLSLICFIFYFFLRSLLWHQLIKSSGNKFSYIKSSYLLEISEIKRYTPGNIWAFLSRAKLFSENNISQKAIGKSLISEFLLIILACLSISSFYIAFILNNTILCLVLMIANIIFFLGFIFNHKFKLKFLNSENYIDNLKSYSISLLAFFVFGLATYFGSQSIFDLGSQNIFFLISLFVFALLVGYLSIITPMGLGVREGVVTFGLSPLTSLANAGLISIYTRIIFIISEILFLIIVFSIHKLKKFN